MNSERWSQIEGLFLQAVEMEPGARERFLQESCKDDAELRREVDTLLACDVPGGPLLDNEYLANAALAVNDVTIEVEGRRIGPYRVVREIGRGGMGSVLLAIRDDDHYRKAVAIKLLKRGMDTDSMLARFRRERQILANLEHPFIASLLDGGATDDGLPYFVMEYVDGLPITTYCTSKNLSTRARLELFRLVCEAVQYAHQNLVIHCDLKPGNILVTKEGIPKLLDFGIAKMLTSSLGEKTAVTGRELRMLTPEYASPEQVMGLPSNTAVDVYSLGTVLYEVLTGKRAHNFDVVPISEIEKMICEAEAIRPSQAAPDKRRELSGDLDNIVATAMHKDPQRRYSSVAQMSEDIRRHCEGLPILAQEDRWGYRAGKFIKRHRLGVLAASLVAASLVIGIVATTYQARRADRRFQLVREIGMSVLSDLHPQVEKLPGSTAAQLSMIQTVARYLDALADDTHGDASLDFEVATAYYRVAGLEGHPTKANLGQTPIAREHYLKALSIFERLAQQSAMRAKATVEVIETHLELTGVCAALGDPAGSNAHLQKAKEIAEDAIAGGMDIRMTTQVRLFSLLSGAATQRGDFTMGQKYGRRAAEASEQWVSRERTTPSIEALRSTYVNLGESLANGGNSREAREYYERALKISEELAQREDVSFGSKFALSGLHHMYGDILGAPDDPNMGEPAAALAHYRTAARINETISKIDPGNVSARRNLAGSHRRIGLMLLESDPRASLEHYRKAVALSTPISEADPSNIQYRSALADGLFGEGAALHFNKRHREAVEVLRRVIEMQRSIEQVDPNRVWFLRTTSRAFLYSGHALLAAGDETAALAAYHEGLDTAQRTLRRAPASPHHSLDTADLTEAIGRYHALLARRTAAAGSGGVERLAHIKDARIWFEKSLAIWQDWIRRGMSPGYAAKRRREVSSLLAATF
jgi:tetratricopeptide (TPR) repeat protein